MTSLHTLTRRRIATLAGVAGLLGIPSITAAPGDARRVALQVSDLAGVPLAS